MNVDVVFTWVNHNDIGWQELKRNSRLSGGACHGSVDSESRFFDRGEIYYSVQSVKQYLPWVRRIFIVTNCTPLRWMEEDSQVTVVDHKDVFPSSDCLPTFNSHAIEACLHRITGLSENFLYFNDDVFVLKPCNKVDFFPASGGISLFLSPHGIPDDKEQLRPVDMAAKNAAGILMRDFGFKVSKKLQHAPFVLKRSVMQEIENLYKEEVDSTRIRRYRHPDDLPLATTFHAYYYLERYGAVIKNTPCRYIDIGSWLFLGLVHPFSPLMRGDYTFLCLNEVEKIFLGPRLRDWIVVRLMKKLFSFK